MNSTIQLVLQNIQIDQQDNQETKNEMRKTKTAYKILLTLYKEITASYLFIVNNYFINDDEGKQIIPQVKSMNFLTSPSNYFPKEIREYVLKNTKKCVFYKFPISNSKNAEIYFYYYGKQPELKNYKFKKYITYILTWLYYINNVLITKTATTQIYNCCKTLKIHIFLTHFKKHISEKGQIMSSLNVNTGFTEFCPKNGTIVIYRKEEWFKVFIHETLHAFGLEFSILDITKASNETHKLFNIKDRTGNEKSLINIFEAYVEFWARIINIIFYSINRTHINQLSSLLTSFENEITIRKIKNLIEVEILFSLFQSNKILVHSGLSYNKLITTTTSASSTSSTAPFDGKNKDKYYIEGSTNVFPYYIITTILLYNYKDFLDWCLMTNGEGIINFNKKIESVDSFLRFIKHHYKSPELIENFDIIRQLYIDIVLTPSLTSSSKNKILDKKIETNLLMSSFDPLITMFSYLH